MQRCTPPLGTCYNLRAKHHLTKRPRRNVESEIYVRSQKTRIFLKTTIYTLVQVLTVVHVYLHLAHVVLCAMRHVSAAARSHRQSILTQHGVDQHPARLRTISSPVENCSLTFRPKTPPPFKNRISWDSHIFLFSSIDTHLISEVRAVLPHYPQVSVGVDSFHLHIAAAF